MEENMIAEIKALKASKRLGQNFMVNESIAGAEAEYARNRNAVELGPGMGMLTEKLCVVANKVFAIEKDHRLFDTLKYRLKCKNLELIHNDFFKVDKKMFSGYDIMVSNIPYNLSSKTISWLSSMHIEGLLCLQKEFVQHMLAKPGANEYSRLSVTTSLSFAAYEIMRVPRNNFYPVPNVDSLVVYLKPRASSPTEAEISVITLIMEHKKKRLKNAIIDSSKGLGISAVEANRLASGLSYADERVFRMSPEEILKVSDLIISSIKPGYKLPIA